jgi:hypothetical protein
MIENFAGGVKSFFADKSWVFWIITIIVAYIMYSALMAHAVMVTCAC